MLYGSFECQMHVLTSEHNFHSLCLFFNKSILDEKTCNRQNIKTLYKNILTTAIFEDFKNCIIFACYFRNV